MTDDQHGQDHGHQHGRDHDQGQGAPQGAGRWDPLPQGDYDDGATAFVKLPEGGVDALLAARGESPLAAPGHGYVPPRITAAPDRPDADASGTGAWPSPVGGAEWPAPASGSSVGDDRFTYNPGSTGQWTFEETPAAPAPAPGHDVTGQWSIPVAGGDLPDESGEFTASALVEQWGGAPPATLPGGAPAPWATEPAQDPADPSAQPWEPQPESADRPGRAAASERHADDVSLFAPRAGDEDGAHAVEAHEAAYGTSEAHGGTQEAHRGPEGPYSGSREPYAEPGAAAEGVHDPESGHDVDAVRDAYGDRDPDAVRDTEAAPGAIAPEDSRAGNADHSHSEPSADDAETESAAPRSEADASDAGDDTVSSTRVDDGHGAHPREDPDADQPPAAPPFHEEHPLASYVLRVNGSDRPVTDAWIGESLLYVLRERLGLAGAKDGCSQGECGACNVQVDGRLVASCLVPAVTTAGSEVRTVEGLAVDGQPSDVQRALARCGAVQCGFCVPGMAMTVHDLLEGNPAPTELEARQALCGNLCRCSGYRGVLRAVQDVVDEREAHAAADAETDGDEARIPHQAGPGAGGVHPSAFENPAQPHPHDPVYGQGQDGGQA
ncbi:2Fe-2S iron-sulfur cluster-binding protein [Streptomyces sp. NPDC101166]|uniref:2Fe-2S iron-sulfur cluster-binding protein n=1 Tax=Streptomyces sp. NPDC101166 TaxID=3366120 RepID=UPI00380CF0AC